uniref:Bifunctional inhibitor/plant lipid transfer protein/seed storage helical domain-containing protein n=1 Tax=Leersia perrieri TaxID=77586 RepID=A0A0D9W022_9ORYZ
MAAGRASGLAVACLMAATAALLAAAASAQTTGCTAALINLYPCLNYISGNETSPTRTCCSQLASVVQNQPQCLCAAISGDSSSSIAGVTIDKARALELPKACNVVTPPASRCNASGGNAPGAATTTSPATQTAGSTGAGAGVGSKTTPTAPYLINGAASLRGAMGLVLALAAVAVYTV